MLIPRQRTRATADVLDYLDRLSRLRRRTLLRMAAEAEQRAYKRRIAAFGLPALLAPYVARVVPLPRRHNEQSHRSAAAKGRT